MLLFFMFPEYVLQENSNLQENKAPDRMERVKREE